MEAGRLLLRSLSSLPTGQRRGAVLSHHRANDRFYENAGGELTVAVRARFAELQALLEEHLDERGLETQHGIAALARTAWRRVTRTAG